MAHAFHLSIVAPDRTVVEDLVQSLVAPGVEGYLGVQAGHEPTIVALKTGLLEYLDAQNQRNYVAISGGFLEIGGSSAIVLADDAARASEIDVREAEEMVEKARRALRGEASDLTQEEAVQELDRAMNRIKAARRN
ncbi:MAG TPA: ATP synthase F1 subunit epsilon [Fimbriimonadaceae bacterium]|nr:ATP synthase F1 subunit epsilon [Fimbriimonadaceae bacterium]